MDTINPGAENALSRDIHPLKTIGEVRQQSVCLTLVKPKLNMSKE